MPSPPGSSLASAHGRARPMKSVLGNQSRRPRMAAGRAFWSRTLHHITTWHFKRITPCSTSMRWSCFPYSRPERGGSPPPSAGPGPSACSCRSRRSTRSARGDAVFVDEVALDRIGAALRQILVVASPPAASVWPATTKVEPLRSGLVSARPSACTEDSDLALMSAEL